MTFPYDIPKRGTIIFVVITGHNILKICLKITKNRLIYIYLYKDNLYTDKCQEIIIVVGYPQNIGYEV